MGEYKKYSASGILDLRRTWLPGGVHVNLAAVQKAANLKDIAELSYCCRVGRGGQGRKQL